MLVNVKFFKKIFLVLVFLLLSKNLTANEKNQIIFQLNDLNSLEFTFDQLINEKVEKGSCLLEFPGKLKCNYFDDKQKELVINNKRLAITQKRYNKTYYYPISKSPFLNILYKDKLLEIVQSGKLELTDQVIKLIYFDENTVKKVHASITKRSKAQADLTMRFIRALFNFAKFEYRDENGVSHFEENPVHILSHLRAWHHVGRKQTYLNGQQIGAFLDAVDDVRNEGIATSMLFPISVCDYIETALFTGLRKTELVQLKWEQVNLDERSFWVEKTKNGDPLKLPISPHLQSIFERRKEYQTESPYVFNAVNNVGRIVEPKKVLHKVSERGEVVFSMHDLRRTFTTVAERIQTGTYTLKRLLIF